MLTLAFVPLTSNHRSTLAKHS